MKKSSLFLSTFVVLLAILSLLTTSPVAAACGDPAGPGVDWSGCDKSGINVGSLDLSSAILVGTNLTGAYSRVAEPDCANRVRGQRLPAGHA